MLGMLILLGVALGLLVSLLTAMMAWEMVHPRRRTAAWAIARKLPADPGELSLSFEEWRLDRPDGASLPVWEIRTAPSAATPQRAVSDQGITAVFAHGWGHGRVNSLQRIQPFLPLVRRIALYDLRGHGDSSGSPSTLGDGDDDDLVALLERLGPGPFLLVGHSMGAVIALRAVAKLVGRQGSPPEIAGVIAYAPYCGFHRSLRGRLHVNGLPARPVSDLALLVHRLRGITPAAIDPTVLRSVRIPLLVVHGVEDEVAPLSHARQIVEAAPDATLVQVDDATHTDAHSVDAPRHDDAVRAFLHRLRFHASGPRV